MYLQPAFLLVLLKAVLLLNLDIYLMITAIIFPIR